MKNPFWTRELSLDAPFCDRAKELKELVSHARNCTNVVLFSPRRYGKTSLVKRAQQTLRKSGIATIYVDFFGVGSLDEAAARLATQVYAFARKDKSLFQRVVKILSSWRPALEPDPDCGVALTVKPVVTQRGTQLLEETMAGLGTFIAEQQKGVHLVFDEFQELTELSESRQIQGIMRSHIQTHSRASYFFVGSRRRILQDIFNNRKAPFYRSAINYDLKPLPLADAMAFIVDRFAQAGRECPEKIARTIVEKVRGYPFYVQRIPYSIYEVSDERRTIGEKDYRAGLIEAMEEEKVTFEGWLRSLSPRQIGILSALAENPTDQPYAFGYLSGHDIGNASTVRKAIGRLLDLDYIEQEKGVFQVTDPIFALWLRRVCIVGPVRK